MWINKDELQELKDEIERLKRQREKVTYMVTAKNGEKHTLTCTTWRGRDNWIMFKDGEIVVGYFEDVIEFHRV